MIKLATPAVVIIMMALSARSAAADGGLELRRFTPDGTLADKHAVITGKDAVLIVVFATWCQACNKKMGMLNQLANDVRDRGVRVAGVSVDESHKPIAGWMDRHDPAFRVYFADAEVRGGRSLLRSVGVLPTIVLVSTEGTVLRRFRGKISEEALRGALRPLLH